jgi:hypothetical protein
MHMPKRLSLTIALLTVAVVLPAAGAPAASARPVIGIAEQHSDVFGDQRFRDLKLTHARLDLSWDVLHDTGQRRAADAYMKAAHADNVDVLVTFDHSRRHGVSNNPSPARLASEMKAMRKRWPWVHEFSTWNEVNISKKAATVANWWLALTKACPSCTILGADLLDRSATSDSPTATARSLRTWVHDFLKTTHGRQPKVWGLHNYIDANNGRTTVTRAVLSLVKGRIWFTETGGLVSRHNGSKFKIPQGLAHAAATTKFILTRLDAVSLRVDRSYLYQWTKAGTTWDSAFTDGHGQPRASLSYLRQFLGR